jgi:uncharacterized protein (TIGR01244 family)
LIEGVNVDNALRVTDTLFAVGQVQWEQLQQAAQEGFRSVLNLRSPNELGFLPEEQQMVEALGLHYVNIPLMPEQIDEMVITRILKTLEQLPKPVVVHCAAGIRSISIALLSTAIQEGLTPDETIARARQIGFRYIEYAVVNPQIKQRFFDYIARHSKMPAKAA